MKRNLFHFRQQRHSKPFLLLEIGTLHLRLHSIDTGRKPIGVATLREELLTPGESLALLEKIRSILDTDSEVRDLAIVMNSPAIRHQIIGLPHLSAAERQRILLREMKHIPAPGETQGIVSHWSAGRLKEQSATKEYLLCAEINRSIADSLIAVAQEKHFDLIGFTSHAQMVSHLLRECRVDSKLNVALLEASDREGSITLFHSGIWNMDRHFLIGGANTPFDSQIPEGLDEEKVKLEVGRALQYFKQQVRSENINHIFLFGSTARALEIQKLLESSFRIPVTPLVLEGNNFAMKDPADNAGGILPLFGIAHAAALNANFGKYISFLPAEWHVEKHARARSLTLAAVAVVFYTLLGGAVAVLHRETEKIKSREQADTQSPMFQGIAEQGAQQLQASRSFALATEQSDAWLRSKHRIVGELARELAAVAPLQMRVTMLDVADKGDAWQVKLQAEIRSPNGSRSRQLFLEFQDQMRQLACLRHLVWGEARLSDSESMQPEDLDDPGWGSQNLLTFSMQGMVSFSPSPAERQSDGRGNMP